MPDVVDPRVTPTASHIYEFIRQTWMTKGYCPSQSEIGRAVGCSSASIQNFNRTFKTYGYIDRQKHGPRSTKPTDMNRRIFRTAPTDRNPWDSLSEVEAWER